MAPKRTAFEAVLSMLVMFGALAGPAVHAAGAGSRQAEVLANLIMGIAICSEHPCIGDRDEHVRQLLKGRLVSDGYFDYSDLAMAYPSVRGVLQGVVEWNLVGTLNDLSLIVVDFQVAQSALREELERSLPGCEIEAVSEDSSEAGEWEASGQTAEWNCSVHLGEDNEIEVTVHLAPEVAMVEIES